MKENVKNQTILYGGTFGLLSIYNSLASALHTVFQILTDNVAKTVSHLKTSIFSHILSPA